MSQPCRVTNKLVIEGGCLKEPWVPRDIVLRGGLTWIEISKQDKKLIQFVRPPETKHK